MRSVLLTAALTAACGLAAPAPAQYTAVVLHPAGRASSTAHSARPGSQVGAAGTSAFSPNRAALWTGSAASFVDLHPAAGYFRSVAHATDGGIQAGEASIDPSGSIWHALIWRGSAASAVDLHPAVPGYDGSFLNGADGGRQVGTITGPGEAEDRAGLWSGTAASFVNLHPAAYRSSRGWGIGGSAQVGDAMTLDFDTHAVLWHGTPASAIDLHPAAYSASRAFATDGAQQGGEGEGIFNQRFETHALLWTGTAASALSLHPPGYDASDVRGIAGGIQVGLIAGPSTDFNDHAAAWRGSVATMIDLHQFLPAGATDSRALGVAADGTIVGEAGIGTAIVAVLWVPVPPPCYANCDQSTQAPTLNVADFSCFLTRYAAGDPYANCDGSTQAPVLNVSDFGCFLTRYAAGCP